tara:strand:- start:120 stop:1673 length:1554 start_codon:yes stop_codon:yes gene_type:complete
MSIIPEIIIQRALVNGIRQIRSSPWRSDQLFKTVPQTYAREFFNLIKNTPIDITMNYPREDSQFPCVCILLRAEEETDVFLGDFMSGGYTDKGSLMGTNEFFFTDEATQPPSTAFGSINSIGEAPRLFDRKERTYKEVMGSGFSCSYLLQVMTDDQDFTVFLYHLVRYIVLSNISMLTANGIHQLRLSGTDFLPQASQQPNFIFMRGINMSFLYFADHFLVEGDEGMEGIAKAFVIDMGLASKKDFGVLTSVQKPAIESINPATGTQGTTVSCTVTGINFQAEIGHYDYLTVIDINMEDNFLTLSSDTTIKHVHLAGEALSGGGGISTLSKAIRPGDEVVYVDDATVFAEFAALGSGEFFASIGAGLKIDFIKSGEKTSGSSGYIKSDSIVVGDVNNEIIYSNSSPAANISTSDKYVSPTAVPASVGAGMFLQIIGPTSHPAYNEQRRITSVVGDSVVVANKFSGNLVGATVRVLKRSNTITFNATISSDAPLGSWDVVLTNPDLITATLKNSFTVT